MTREHPPEYQSGDLKFCPALGQVSNQAGDSIRLGPVNMKVLEALLARAGEVVSRGEIYETVWKNQIVGEDALTRCISDIRAELRHLSGRGDWIETVPKRGYRWIEPVDEPPPLASAAAGPPAARAAAGRAGASSRAIGRRALRLAGRGAGYFLALLAMASMIVWSIDRFSDAGVPVVAVLPVSVGPDAPEIAAQIDIGLAAYLMGLEGVQLLSRSAIESRPPNPFPFFYYEFGARWLIESDLRTVAGHEVLTINVADARTGIVEMQATERITDANLETGGLPETAFSTLRQYIESQLTP